MRREWANIPLPENYVIALIAGGVLHYFWPFAITSMQGLVRGAGGVVLTAGIVLTTWSFVVLDSSRGLATNGPYRFGRHPIYLGWAVIAVGVGLLANSVWLVGFVPFAFLYLHLVSIPGEEAGLEERFGEEYVRYRDRARKYI